MFTKAELTTSDGRLLTLQLVEDSSGITIEDIDGLGPVKATLTASQIAGQDVSELQNAQRGPRNITMTLGLAPDPAVTSVNSLRRMVYSFFRPKSLLAMKFFVDDTDDTIEDGYLTMGNVESCDPGSIFTQTPTLDISVMCYDPDFTDPVPVTISTLTTADTTPMAVDYDGTSPTGMLITVDVNTTLSEFAVYCVDPNGATSTMDVAYPFVAGDQVTINTISGSKYANLLRAGVTSSILFAISTQSTYVQFSPGGNSVRVFASGTNMPVSIVYTKRFGEL